MCHGFLTDLVRPPRKRFMNPRLFNCSSSSASLNSPCRMRWNTRVMPISTSRFSTPRIHRKIPDTDAPTMPVTECNSEPSSSTCSPRRGRRSTAGTSTRTRSSSDRGRTGTRPTAACGPNRRPAACGWRCPPQRCGRRRTRAEAPGCRREYRRRPRRSPVSPPRSYALGTTNAISTPNPTTCRNTMNPYMPTRERQSCRVSDIRNCRYPDRVSRPVTIGSLDASTA